MNNFFNKEIFKTRKFKYGSVATAFIVIFIALILVINVIITALDNKFGLYIDTTKEKIYDVGDESRAILDSIDSDIEIIFCRDRDKLASNTYMNMVVTLAENYERLYPNIKVKFCDIARNPKEVEKFKETTSSKLYATSVIVNCPDTGKYKVYTNNTAFFTFTENNTSAPYGFNGEMRFTSAIISVTGSANDKIVFTVGHGETVSSSSFIEIFQNAGYSADSVLSIDLSTQDIPDNTKLVIISNPLYDFAGEAEELSGSVNEISKLKKYLNSFGNLFVLINNQTEELPEISELLKEDYGISWHSGETVKDTEKSVSADGLGIISQYNDSEDDTYAYKITKEITSASSSKTVMSNTTPLYINKDKQSLKVSPVLMSSDKAQVTLLGKEISKGQSVLMAVSTYTQYVNNEEKTSNVIVSGSTDFSSASYISSATYANADVVYSILKLAGRQQVPINIEFRPFEDTGISDISMSSIKNTAVVLSLVFPAIILAAGIVVWRRRKSL